MIQAEMTIGRAVIRVHDEYISEDADAALPRLNRIVSASYKRRLTAQRRDPQRRH